MKLSELKKKIGHNSFKIHSFILLNKSREDYLKKLEEEYPREHKFSKNLLPGNADKAILFFSLWSEKDIMRLINIPVKKDSKIRRSVIGSKDYFDKRVSKKEKMIDISIELFLMSLLLSPHAEFTRYPNDVISPLEYNKKLG